MKGIKSVLVDNSFCIRLLKADDEYHQNTVDYLEYFLDKGVEIYLSTIVVGEYAVGDNPLPPAGASLAKRNSFHYIALKEKVGML